MPIRPKTPTFAPDRLPLPRPTDEEMAAAYRTLALCYVHNYPSPNKKVWGEWVAEAVGCFEEDEDVSDELYEGVQAAFGTL